MTQEKKQKRANLDFRILSREPLLTTGIFGLFVGEKTSLRHKVNCINISLNYNDWYWLIEVSVKNIRQAIYGSMRFGMYPMLKLHFCGPMGECTMMNKVLAGCSAGALSSAICNPTGMRRMRSNLFVFSFFYIISVFFFVSLFDT